MKVYLVRHGTSSPGDVDPQKGLSDQGKAEIGALANGLKHLGINVSEIRHSGKARAEQTAQIMAGAVQSKKGVNAVKGLAPNDPVENVADELVALGDNLMLVGHLPFMAKLVSYLLAGDTARCSADFQAGGIACLEYDKGKWTLLWMAYPELFSGVQTGQFRSYH
jgi:phosphohistidine phosphatase